MKKGTYIYELPRSIVEVVKSLCVDYPRRARALKNRLASEVLLCEYKRINDAIDKALADVEVGIRDYLLKDISDRRGYDCSEACICISKDAYYRRKRKVVHDIAKGLNLIE